MYLEKKEYPKNKPTTEATYDTNKGRAHYDVKNDTWNFYEEEIHKQVDWYLQPVDGVLMKVVKNHELKLGDEIWSSLAESFVEINIDSLRAMEKHNHQVFYSIIKIK